MTSRLIVSCALCQVLEKRQLGAQCPEETNKMLHRPDVMAASTEGCEGKRSWPGPVEGREVFPEAAAVSGDSDGGLECPGLVTGRGRAT